MSVVEEVSRDERNERVKIGGRDGRRKRWKAEEMEGGREGRRMRWKADEIQATLFHYSDICFAEQHLPK